MINHASAATSHGSPKQDRPMPERQQNLVNSCFEEGQYGAVSFVYNLPYQPSPHPEPLTLLSSHLRQLLYIALWPFDSENSALPSIDDAKKQETFTPMTPTKSNPMCQEKSSLLPAPKDADAALNLLNAFARTNSPSSLLRALPHLKTRPFESAPAIHEDSFIAREAIRIERARHCWAILQQGFIQRSNISPVASPRKKTRRYGTEATDDIQRSSSPGIPVAAHAWPILEWIIYLCEREEEENEAKNQCRAAPLNTTYKLQLSQDNMRYSPFLLSQIPSSQWEAEAVIDVILFCLQSAEETKCSLGYRLLLMITNLNASGSFELQKFAYLPTRRVSTSQSETLSAFFDYVPRKTAAAIRFMVVLCEQYLTISSANGISRTKRAKPQVRARRAGTQKETGDQSETITHTDHKGLQKLILPLTKDVLALLAAEHDLPVEDAARIQSELVIAYTKAQRSIPDCADQEWREALSDGRLENALSKSLSEEELEALMDIVQSILDI